jgi:glycosyltransferase involved in cell wall biosynthesis
MQLDPSVRAGRHFPRRLVCDPVRVLVWHGFLLGGTGSNVYNARLCAAFAQQGHEISLVSQEPHAKSLQFVDAIGHPDGLEVLREPVRVTAWKPDIGGLLPVYVQDRYEGVEARTYLDISDAELEEYLARNVAAVREICAMQPPDIALANHLVMGPLVLARALGDSVPYAVKIHGSALEYVVKRDPQRFEPFAREGLARARTVLVGSRHTAESLWAAMGDDELPARTRLGPPGVDIAEFRPRADAAELVAALADELEHEPASALESAFSRDAPAAAAALRGLRPEDRHVVFVGKLIVSKGVDLLVAAWPLVLAQVPDARLVVVGFGAYREALERLLAALAAGDLDAVRALAEEGRAAEGGPREPLRHLLAFLDTVDEAYLDAARALPDRVVLSGRLEHAELAPLLAMAEAQVVPSTFPEAFGMVAAEAAACGALPVSSDHSGLSEVTRTLADAVPAAARSWLAFPTGDVRGLADRLVAWLEAPEDLRIQTRAALVRVARERYSWDGVARGVIAAAEGRLDDLPRP